jgi:hypothetical protein
MASEAEWYIERGHAFGRGSPVREYWLERCDGFEAIATNGKRLGPVTRIQTPSGGVFLRLGGRRSRVVPAAAVERVWPGACMLVIAEEDVSLERETTAATAPESAGARAAEEHGASTAATLRWEDDTLPWWDLIPENRLVGRAPHQRRFASASTVASGAIRRDVARAETVARKLAGWTRDKSKKLGAQTRAILRTGRNATGTALDVVRRRCRAAYALSVNLVKRARLRLGRLLARLAVWVAGDDRDLRDAVTRDSRASPP